MISSSSTPTTSTSSDGNGRSSAWPTMGRPPPSEPIQYVPSSDACKIIESVPAVVNYVAHETTEISTRRDLAGSDDALIGALWAPTVVRMNNARLGVVRDTNDTPGTTKELTLDENGFELHSNLSDEDFSAIIKLDFCNQEEVVDTYYDLCQKIVEVSFGFQPSHSGDKQKIACVCAFDHNVRSTDRASVGQIKSNASNASPDEAAGAPQVQNPAGLVHADYTRDSAPRRLLDLSKPPKLNDVLRPKLLAQDRVSLLDPIIVQEALDGKRRFAFVNVWRNIDADNPVMDTPLACVDTRTSHLNNLRVFKIHYVDRVGENYFVCPSKEIGAQKWYYYPMMTMNESLLLKQWDSKGGIAGGVGSDGVEGHETSTFTIHSAFLNPSCPEGAPPRKSIEVRCVVIWEKEEQ
eukprot:CAMPEP_0171329256 /NCGR_PEP_ID=MMETSP0878-20121228/1161_1 /TAXON_ID=67004 /ORGANISM="Thalassiosira weissflogii, Strain CCMP1336" /LENGTH=406 /DNA_ID=CAMNT_0011829217 /DNA_START=285 /DNA_END=1505 /DNA_ORIENTATION=-